MIVQLFDRRNLFVKEMELDEALAELGHIRLIVKYQYNEAIPVICKDYYRTADKRVWHER